MFTNTKISRKDRAKLVAVVPQEFNVDFDFNAFDIVFAMENVNGAPEYSTDLIGTLFYRYGIAGQHPIGIPDAGLGAAIATITFLLLLVLVIPTLKNTQRST